MSRFAVESGRKGLADATGAVHRWAVDGLAEIDALDRHLVRESAMSVFRLPAAKEITITRRLFCAVFATIPRFRDMIRVVAYRFG